MSNTLAVIGAISGVIGTLTGLLALKNSRESLRRTTAIKTLDLRLELRRAVSSLHSSMEILGYLLDGAEGSRKAVASARGSGGSRLQMFLTLLQIDRDEAAAIRAAAPFETKNFNNLSEAQLEQKLVEVHALQNKIDFLTMRYRGALDADDKERALIAAERNSLRN